MMVCWCLLFPLDTQQAHCIDVALHSIQSYEGSLLLGVIDVNTELATQGPECDLANIIASILDVGGTGPSYHIFLDKQLFSEEVLGSRGCHGRRE
jgi:hypothetical protein